MNEIDHEAEQAGPSPLKQQDFKAFKLLHAVKTLLRVISQTVTLYS